MTLQAVTYAKQILIVLTFMESNGFMIGPEIKKLFKIKVDTPTAGHPVEAGLPQHINNICSLEYSKVPSSPSEIA